ncbi:Glutamine-dependent NAD(+) synthetase [Paragonimus heterotremus]|uniref:Glutamine-dependent NAD(+) synthetase n=1 Tax=Paragonimus heterotremus TaxID=100268 RepID=A0A8J4WE24_9TREM|nr:Glutamine-dependent NAD(+) synthetase [Paragonimus heterotremus]
MSTSLLQHALRRKFTVSLCVLNQWALDFAGNTERILRSIERSKEAGARYRLGPELELSGYGCEDHFHELDTFTHSWECLAKILEETKLNPKLTDIICDIGMPVLLSGVAYNCRVVLLNGRLLLIRPKLVLADGGLHRETRWFTAWPHSMRVIEYNLPSVVCQVAADTQKTACFGDALLHFVGDVGTDDIIVGLETCEELWIGTPPHLQMYASGADVVLNASASHHELRKCDRRINLVQMASRSNGGGLYAYTNLRGCDSERVCYDGGAMAAVNGKLVHLSKQFGFEEVEISTVTVDVGALRASRIGNKSFGRTSAAAVALNCGDTSKTGYPMVKVNFSACYEMDWFNHECSTYSSTPHTALLKPEEEIALGPSLWLWDMLRRSKSAGFFLCLSGGLDSASVACLVFSLCNQLHLAVANNNEHVLHSCSTIFNQPACEIRKFTVRDFCSRLLYTCYMPSEHSSADTRSRSARLAEAIGSQHLVGNISPVVSSLLTTAVNSLQLREPPRFTVDGGSRSESVALQNVQARSRLVFAYLLAQLLPSQRKLSGGLLVLSSANLDESLCGYLTKYDCSSADLNPIGSISKADLRRFIRYCAESLSPCLGEYYGVLLRNTLKEIYSAPPTAELMPLLPDGNIQQTDEEDMGLTYNMLSLFGRLRKIESCGPYSMLRTLLDGAWMEIRADIPKPCLDSENHPNVALAQFLADKVKLFFHNYAVNRHKATILPPSYHTENYSADDNR